MTIDLDAIEKSRITELPWTHADFDYQDGRLCSLDIEHAVAVVNAWPALVARARELEALLREILRGEHLAREDRTHVVPLPGMNWTDWGERARASLQGVAAPPAGGG